MRAALRLHVVLAAGALLVLLGNAGSRRVDLNADLLDVWGDLDICPGCAENAESYHPKDIANNLQKMKRGRNTYVDMEETCQCMPDSKKWHFLTLSAGHYPATILEVNCTAGSCSDCFKPFECMGHKHLVQVLQTRMRDEPVDFNLPEALRMDWKFDKIPVNIGCKCARRQKY